jgi:hypothetical protein
LSASTSTTVVSQNIVRPSKTKENEGGEWDTRTTVVQIDLVRSSMIWKEVAIEWEGYIREGRGKYHSGRGLSSYQDECYTT